MEVTTADGWPGKDQWRDTDLMVLYLWNHDWPPERLGQLDPFLARGGGVVALHAALIADGEPEALARRSWATTPGRWTTRCSASRSCGVSPGPPGSLSPGSTPWLPTA